MTDYGRSLNIFDFVQWNNKATVYPQILRNEHKWTYQALFTYSSIKGFAYEMEKNNQLNILKLGSIWNRNK